MKKSLILIRPVFALLAIVFSQACVNLNEKVYDTVTTDSFYKNEKQYVSVVASAYSQVRQISAYVPVWDTEDLCTDQQVTPTRGTNWDEGGAWRKLHEHTWTYEHEHVKTIWTYGFGCVNKANEVSYQLSQAEDQKLKEKFLSELALIRAFGYYYLINGFGNVPIVDRYDVPSGYLPKNAKNFEEGRKAAFNFAVNDITASITSLSEQKGGALYGRFNKWAACALLAKYYLNAETWTGIAKWDECIAACDEIINKGGYTLESDYFANFVSKNEGSKENIFVIPFDNTRTSWGLIFWLYYLHYSDQAYYNTAYQPWNGPCAVPSFIKSFDKNDKRLKGWLIGPRITPNGEKLLCTEDSKGMPLNYTIDFVNIYDSNDKTKYDHTNSREYFGARFAKYEIEQGLPASSMGNDLAIYRLADIMLMKAEALMRKQGSATQEAVDLVNRVRARAFDNDPSPYTISTLTFDALLKERGWELYNECVRRNDLIRFKKFVRGTWEFADRSAESDTRNVFPIPQSAVSSNTNLTQNPGY